jgi:hypothetical protein
MSVEGLCRIRCSFEEWECDAGKSDGRGGGGDERKRTKDKNSKLGMAALFI